MLDTQKAGEQVLVILMYYTIMYLYIMLSLCVNCAMVYTETLPEFIAHHTVEKLCLPCKLVLPQSSGGSVPQVRRKPAGMRQALQSGAGETEGVPFIIHMHHTEISCLLAAYKTCTKRELILLKSSKS